MVELGLLKNIDALSGLTDQNLEDFGKHVTSVHLDKGSHLFYRNDPSSGLYFVSQGSLQIIIDNEANKEIIVYTIMQGDIVGEMTLFDESARSATVIALEECRLCKISNNKFIELMNTFPKIAINLSRVLIDRLHAANSMIERLGMMDGNQRVAHYLKTLIMRDGTLEDSWYSLPKKPTYRFISQRLGVSEKTVYRTVQTMLQDGNITIKGRKLMVKQDFLDSIH
jgi:CRP-like cAMP-binding protein